MLKVGIMGGASIVSRVAAGIRDSGVAEVAALARRNEKQAQVMAEELKIPQAYGSYRTLVNDPGLDLIYIPLINSEHFNGAKMALNAGKHVLLEKPFTLTTREAEGLFDLAREKNLFLMEAQKEVFLPVNVEVKRLIDEERLGQIEYVSLKESRPESPSKKWFLDLRAGGGAFLDNASYPLSLLQYLFGIGFDEVTGLHLSENRREADWAAQVLLKKKSVLFSVFIDSQTKFQSRIEIQASRARLIIPNYWKTQEAAIIFKTGEEEKISYPHQSEFAFEIRHVAECIEEGLIESPIMTSEFTLSNVSVVEKLYRSWYGENWPKL